MGLASLGAGVSRGELAGTAAEAKLRQTHAMELYRQQLLAASREKATGADARAAAALQARKAQPYLHALADPEMKGFFDRNPSARADWEYRAGLRGVDPAALPPDPNYDPATGTLRTPGGRTYGAEGYTGAPGGGGTATPTPAPPDAFTRSLREPIPTPGLPQGAVPFDYVPPSQEPDISAVGLAGPRTVTSAFGLPVVDTRLPTPELPRVFSGEPAAGLPPYTPTPTTTDTSSSSAAAGGTAAAPPDPTADPASPFFLGYLPGETDKRRALRIGSASKAAVAQLGKDRFAAMFPGIVAAGILKGLKVEEEPYAFGARMEGTVASTALKNAQTAALQQFAPLKSKKILSDIAHTTTVDELNALKTQLDQQYHAQLVDIGRERNRIAGANQTSTGALNAAKVRQINHALSTEGRRNATADERARLQYNAKILSRTRRTQSGASAPVHDDLSVKAARESDEILQRMDQRRTTVGTSSGTGTPTKSTPGGGRPAASASTGVPSYPGAPVTQGERQHVAQEINNGTFSTWMNSPQLQDPALRQRAKAAYRMLTGADWTGK